MSATLESEQDRTPPPPWFLPAQRSAAILTNQTIHAGPHGTRCKAAALAMHDAERGRYNSNNISCSFRRFLAEYKMAHHVLLHFAAQVLVQALQQPHQQARRPPKQLDIYAVGASTMGASAPRKRCAP